MKLQFLAISWELDRVTGVELLQKRYKCINNQYNIHL